jgi:hypothetical protein
VDAGAGARPVATLSLSRRAFSSSVSNASRRRRWRWRRGCGHDPGEDRAHLRYVANAGGVVSDVRLPVIGARSARDDSVVDAPVCGRCRVAVLELKEIRAKVVGKRAVLTGNVLSRHLNEHQGRGRASRGSQRAATAPQQVSAARRHTRVRRTGTRNRLITGSHGRTSAPNPGASSRSPCAPARFGFSVSRAQSERGCTRRRPAS